MPLSGVGPIEVFLSVFLSTKLEMENKMSNFEIPLDLLRQVRIMYVQKSNCERTFAASTLEAWRKFFPQDIPGLSAPLDDALRLTHFNADPDAEDQTYFCPVFTWEHDQMVALMFSDQSMLVARKTSGRLQALPVIFHLRKESNDVTFSAPVIRSMRKPEACISFRTHARETHLKIYSKEDLKTLQGQKIKALAHLEGDLDKLAPLFSNLPYVRQPMDKAPCGTDNTIDLSFLPHRWFSSEEAREAQKWAIDAADWILLQKPEYEEVKLEINPRKPDERRKSRFLGSPLRYFCKLKPQGPFSINNCSGDALPLLKSISTLSLPIPENRLYEMEFVKTGLRAHSVRASVITSGRRSHPISKHRELELMSRFSL